MNRPSSKREFGFFTTPPHDCGYLPGQTAITMFADPRMRLNTATYTFLSQHGFRRSGNHIYRPQCSGCEACVAVRIPVREFVPRRSHRRTLGVNAGIEVSRRPPSFNPEHFQLYRHYLSARHPNGGMDNPDADAYLEFLTAWWAETVFFEFRAGSELVAVAVADRLDDGLSAVYTFFSPDYPNRSLGRLAILKEIEIARNLQLKWLYLGYWIAGCRKMAYKNDYRPLEYYLGGRWARTPP